MSAHPTQAHVAVLRVCVLLCPHSPVMISNLAMGSTVAITVTRARAQSLLFAAPSSREMPLCIDRAFLLLLLCFVHHRVVQLPSKAIVVLRVVLLVLRLVALACTLAEVGVLLRVVCALAALPMVQGWGCQQSSVWPTDAPPPSLPSTTSPPFPPLTSTPPCTPQQLLLLCRPVTVLTWLGVLPHTRAPHLLLQQRVSRIWTAMLLRVPVCTRILRRLPVYLLHRPPLPLPLPL